MNPTTIHDLPAAWRADPHANAEGCARQLEELLSSMQAPAEIRTIDHPEANARKPQFGEQEYVFGFVAEDGRPFAVRMGAEGWRNHSQHVLDMLTEAPSYNDGSLKTTNEQSEKIVSLTAQLDFCRNTLLNAGWTHQEGAKAWKPPVNVAAGETWRKLIETEEELAAAMKAVKDLAGQLTQRERQLAQTIAELDETQAMLSKEQRWRIEAEERPQAELDKLRLEVAELTGRLRERTTNDLRDQFAAAAMSGIAQAICSAHLHGSAQTPPDDIAAGWAWDYADAMLAARTAPKCGQCADTPGGATILNNA